MSLGTMKAAKQGGGLQVRSSLISLYLVPKLCGTFNNRILLTCYDGPPGEWQEPLLFFFFFLRGEG